jgi:hypothetical protein
VYVGRLINMCTVTNKYQIDLAWPSEHSVSRSFACMKYRIEDRMFLERLLHTFLSLSMYGQYNVVSVGAVLVEI